jgi:hypothetical protein
LNQTRSKLNSDYSDRLLATALAHQWRKGALGLAEPRYAAPQSFLEPQKTRGQPVALNLDTLRPPSTGKFETRLGFSSSQLQPAINRLQARNSRRNFGLPYRGSRQQ